MADSSVSVAYYDAFTQYDDIIESYYAENKAIPALLRKLLGRGQGLCLDLGCGSGINGPLVAGLGYETVGIDISQTQLEVARQKKRLKRLVHGDASKLPFADNTFTATVSCYTHTDFDDWERALTEAYRTLKPGGRFVYVGPHPCFFGGLTKEHSATTRIIHSGYYKNPERIFEAPGFSSGGVRQTIGERHLSLEAFLNGFIKSGLRLEGVYEAEHTDPPITIGLCAIKELDEGFAKSSP